MSADQDQEKQSYMVIYSGNGITGRTYIATADKITQSVIARWDVIVKKVSGISSAIVTGFYPIEGGIE